MFASPFDGPKLAARHRSCPATEGATTACCLAARAAVDRPGPCRVFAPLSSTETGDGKGRGGGRELKFTAAFREMPPPRRLAHSTSPWTSTWKRQPPCGQHHGTRCGRRWGPSGTVAAALSSFSTSQCRRWVVNWWKLPNVVSPVVEQNVHIPVRGGGRSKIPRGGVQGLRPGQGPTFQFFSPAPAVFPATAPVVEYISHSPAVFPASAPVIEYFSPAPAVFPATAPVEEFISHAPAVFPATTPVDGVSLTRACRVASDSASGGVFLTRVSRVPGDSASGGVHFTRASRVSSDSASGGVFLTRASRVPGVSSSCGVFLTRASRVSCDSSSG